MCRNWRPLVQFRRLMDDPHGGIKDRFPRLGKNDRVRFGCNLNLVGRRQLGHPSRCFCLSEECPHTSGLVDGLSSGSVRFLHADRPGLHVSPKPYLPAFNRVLPVMGHGTPRHLVCLDTEDLFRLNFRKRSVDRSVRCAKAPADGTAVMGLRERANEPLSIGLHCASR